MNRKRLVAAAVAVLVAAGIAGSVAYGWLVQFVNDTGAQQRVSAFVYCASF